jgi:hypothetical protein
MQMAANGAARPDSVFTKRDAMNLSLNHTGKAPNLSATVAARTHRQNLWRCGYGRVNKTRAFRLTFGQADEFVR